MSVVFCNATPKQARADHRRLQIAPESRNSDVARLGELLYDFGRFARHLLDHPAFNQ